MGTVYKPTFTKPLPSNGELFTSKGETFARVKPLKGRAVTYPVTTGKDGSQRIVVESGTYVAKYRDGSGLVHTVSTGCRDEGAARSVLGELERRSELVKSGVLTAGEDRIADHAATPLVDHFAAYLTSLRAGGKSPRHITDTERLATRVFDECEFKSLRDFDTSRLESWLATCLAEGMAARTRNSYLQAVNGFCGWCIRSKRLASNPLKGIAKADITSDRRLTRRAMTEVELHKLLHVARWRPLAEFGRESVRKDSEDVHSKRGTWNAAPLTFDGIDAAVDLARERLANNPDFATKLELRGRERQLVYKTLVTTGLRKGELASVKLRHLDLDAERAFLTLDAASEKNRQGNSIPLRVDLADDLRSWLADRLTLRRQSTQHAPTIKFNRKAGREAEKALPLSPDEPLFDVPDKLVKILDRDLEAAGIPKRDDRGRTLDVHALRHTFGTHLSMAGVSLRTAQAAMRHSTPTLTANIYTDPRLLDVHGAVEALPMLSLTMTRQEAPEVMRATGTTGTLDSQLVPVLVPTSGKPCLLMAYTGTHATQSECDDQAGVIVAKHYPANENASKEASSFEAFEGWLTGLEPATPGSTIRCSNQLSYNHHEGNHHEGNHRKRLAPQVRGRKAGGKLVLTSEGCNLRQLPWKQGSRATFRVSERSL